MQDLAPWIEHIRHPLVLAGFTLALLAGLAKRLDLGKTSGKDKAALFGKLLNYFFLLALLITVLGLGQAYLPKPAGQSIDNTGPGSVSINAQGNVNQDGAVPPKTPINQTIQGNQGSAINSGGSVKQTQETPDGR